MTEVEKAEENKGGDELTEDQGKPIDVKVLAQELEDFVDQLNTKQFKMIENFFATMPKLTHTVKVKNPKTNVESTIVLEGLAAFFN